MKKFFVLAIMLSTTFVAMAGSGKAVIPYWFSFEASNGDFHVYVLSLSNTSSEDLTVNVTFYEEQNSSGSPNVLLDGDDSTSTGALQAVNPKTYDESPSTGSSVQVVIRPYETTRVLVYSTIAQAGYGQIEWTQNSDRLHTMVAHGYLYNHVASANREAINSVPINGGMPF